VNRGVDEMYVVIVKFDVKAGCETQFLRRAVAQADASLEHEPQCRRFDVCSDPSDHRRICLYEVYDDEGAFKAHLATRHFLEFDRETGHFIDRKTVEAWTLCHSQQEFAQWLAE
jgi:autoinducer 2-degrading protein